MYSESLEAPLQKSNRTAIWSNLLYSLSQSIVFFVIALVFWYGSRLVSFREYSTFQFFVGLMVSPLRPCSSNWPLTLLIEYDIRSYSSRKRFLFRARYFFRQRRRIEYYRTLGFRSRNRRRIKGREDDQPRADSRSHTIGECPLPLPYPTWRQGPT